MTIPTGLSAKQIANYRQEAAKTIARFDDNRDGKIDRTEADRQRFSHRDSYSFTNRISDNYVSRTTVTQEHSNAVKAGAFERVDANRDGQISADEMMETYVTEQDNNKDGKLGWWEKTTMGISGMVDMVQRRVTVEVDRTTRMEYDPLPPRPTPPIPYPNDRPTPPSPGGRPTPPRPDSDRPTPPSPGGSSRPTPPSTGGDRPRPPRP